tara:strand:- start:29 stop:778 length:750 start_codon:yes stop_codon:yes gene_type:complete
MNKFYRIGQIVPSSNVTMEVEVPAMLSKATLPKGKAFSFHSSRAPMKTVAKEELIRMNEHMKRCAKELMDAEMDIIASACLVAIMCQGPGYHRVAEKMIAEAVGRNAPPVISSAGALINSLQDIGVKKISFIAPYISELTRSVSEYIEREGIEVEDYISLQIPSNIDVGQQDPMALREIVKKLKTNNVDAIVLSACVQLPSLPALDLVQRQFEVPVLSTASATVFQILKGLKLPTHIPHSGGLLSGDFN